MLFLYSEITQLFSLVFSNCINYTVQEGSEEKNDGWETVHKKPPRRKHKVTIHRTIYYTKEHFDKMHVGCVVLYD